MRFTCSVRRRSAAARKGESEGFHDAEPRYLLGRRRLWREA